MNEKIRQLVALLKGDAVFTATMGEGLACMLFPMVAKEGTPATFAVYQIAREPGTKDGANYLFTLQFFFPTDKHTEMIDFTEAMISLLEGSKLYEMGMTTTDYTDEQKVGFLSLYSTINFNTI